MGGEEEEGWIERAVSSSAAGGGRRTRTVGRERGEYGPQDCEERCGDAEGVVARRGGGERGGEDGGDLCDAEGEPDGRKASRAGRVDVGAERAGAGAKVEEVGEGEGGAEEEEPEEGGEGGCGVGGVESGYHDRGDGTLAGGEEEEGKE